MYKIFLKNSKINVIIKKYNIVLFSLTKIFLIYINNNNKVFIIKLNEKNFKKVINLQNNKKKLSSTESLNYLIIKLDDEYLILSKINLQLWDFPKLKESEKITKFQEYEHFFLFEINNNNCIILNKEGIKINLNIKFVTADNISEEDIEIIKRIHFSSIHTVRGDDIQKELEEVNKFYFSGNNEMLKEKWGSFKYKMDQRNIYK